MPSEPVTPESCAEIATGAPMPDGADAVVMVEETSRAGDDAIDVLSPVAPGQHVGRRGGDIAPGDLVVRRLDLLNPSRIGALAAIGITEVEVYARPRVAILSTGNEVMPPGTSLAPGQIYDVNRFTLSAVVAAHGAAPEPHEPIADTIDDLNDALDACADADVIVFSGGSSVGERDLIVDLIAQRGQMIFHGIAVKPGKPTAFARVGTRGVLRHARQPDLVSLERLHPARSVPARDRPPAALCAADRAGAAGETDRLAGRPPSVLHGPTARWRGAAGVQGIGRHHQPVASGWLYRDTGRSEHGRGRCGRRGDALLIHRRLATKHAKPLPTRRLPGISRTNVNTVFVFSWPVVDVCRLPAADAAFVLLLQDVGGMQIESRRPSAGSRRGTPSGSDSRPSAP